MEVQESPVSTSMSLHADEQSVTLTQSEEESADKAEEQQPPDLLQTLLDRTETAALSQLLPHRQPAGHIHPSAARACSTHM